MPQEIWILTHLNEDGSFVINGAFLTKQEAVALFRSARDQAVLLPIGVDVTDVHKFLIVNSTHPDGIMA